MEKAYSLGLTFDDVLLMPRYAGLSRDKISVESRLTKKIKLGVPLVAAPMDTVTEARLAIALARRGGIGFIHRNFTIAAQVREVAKVKKENVLVGAAIGSTAGFEVRVDALVAAGADVLMVDSAHGHSKQVIAAVTWIKKKYPKIEVIAGNVATGPGALALIKAGADGLRVGMGPGAICSTRLISGMGVPQLTALQRTTKVARKYGVPVIADGGINYSGDITKALAVGASSVMLGRLFAATTESAGKAHKLKPSQVPARFKSIVNGSHDYTFKEYRGMGSLGAMRRGIKVSSEDEFHGKNYTSDTLVAEGVEGLVPCSGSVDKLVNQLMGGLTSGLYYCGSKNIAELQKTAEFVQLTQASLSESHPHDLFITESGGNY